MQIPAFISTRRLLLAPFWKPMLLSTSSGPSMSCKEYLDKVSDLSFFIFNEQHLLPFTVFLPPIHRFFIKVLRHPTTAVSIEKTFFSKRAPELILCFLKLFFFASNLFLIIQKGLVLCASLTMNGGLRVSVRLCVVKKKEKTRD